MFQPIVLQPHLMDAFSQLVAGKLGFHVREQARPAFWQRILQRTKALGLSSTEAYYEVLTAKHQNVTDDAEWRELINFLSVTESYFFRDQGQFSLLRRHVLPDLIAWKQHLAIAGNPEARSLRLWSAGCATGEEAYSLAILLKELIPAHEDWTITVLGTDINQAALSQAKHGVYTDWSFRSVPPEIQKTYFRPYHQDWKIIPEIANLVSFHVDNLIPSDGGDLQSSITNIDLIVCRNVFIYFDTAAIARGLKRFYQALIPGGYLMTGHTELYGQTGHPFQIKVFSESIVYQRARQSRTVNRGESKSIAQQQDEKPPPLNTPSCGAPVAVSPRSLRRPVTRPTGVKDLGLSLLEDIIAILKRKQYPAAIAQAKQLIAQNLYPFRAYCLLAEAYANLGQYDQAIQACQQAFQYDPIAVEPLYLLAQIAQEQGDLENAKAFLRRVIYLAPTSIFAYFELGCLYEQQGNLLKAQTNWRSSLNVLKQLAGSTMIDGCRDLTASELQVAIEQKLSQSVSN